MKWFVSLEGTDGCGKHAEVKVQEVVAATAIEAIQSVAVAHQLTHVVYVHVKETTVG